MHKKFIIAFIFAACTFLAFILVLTYWMMEIVRFNHLNVALFATLFVFLAMNLLLSSHFCFWMWAVKLRYQKVNSFLIEKFITSFFYDHAEEENKNIKKAASIHDKLVDVSECINRCYGFPVSKFVYLEVDFGFTNLLADYDVDRCQFFTRNTLRIQFNYIFRLRFKYIIHHQYNNLDNFLLYFALYLRSHISFYNAGG